MAVFCCAKCGATLTPDLRALEAVPDVSTHEKDRDRKTGLAPSTVSPGHYAIDPEPWGAPFVAPGPDDRRGGDDDRALLMPPDMTGMISAGPRDTVIVHPDDVPGLRPADGLGKHHGCCGPLGTGGRNMACGACGTLVATLAADCMGPHELHLDPVRVWADLSSRHLAPTRLT
ncbi:hypothetical protein ADK76_26495 [Streptomyces griseoflavus]|uniref:hypothetical protein n=1 Tax=Streptomyces rimosus TaxID=1927 RepID=UPI0004C5C1BE|nr:hypothetical protein [Streptomyces rimosus]KOG53735.1 hypothetical protein ADK76_26495 [Streptomyces griseoflavus]